MTDIIRLLPDSVANQIAAGEVIQRPASVLKELVENAIDAGASSVDVFLKDSGKTQIQVIDNGCGMSETDARLAFERHATSKIRDSKDLFSIHTLGFRGEALASIAAIAEVQLRTKRTNDELGTQIDIAGTNLVEQVPVQCSAGSCFTVKSLFYNVPARRKFLKSDTTELTHLLNEFKRIALVNENISFSLKNNKTDIYILPATSRKQRITHIFGKQINACLLDVEVETSLVTISGFVAKPEYAKKSAGEQFFFVNGRYIRHPYLHKAVLQAYSEILPPDHIPGYFIYLEVPPDSLDINIHPTKTEVKFEDERAIFQIIHSTVKRALGKFNVVPSIDFEIDNTIPIPILRDDTAINIPTISVDSDYNPFEPSEQRYKQSYNNHRNVDKWESLYTSFEQPAQQAETFPQEHKAQTALMQLKGRYILTPVKSGLMLIDQKRAHERILFEQYQKRMGNNNSLSQQNLFPESLELSPEKFVLWNELKDDITALGFDVRPASGTTVVVYGSPGETGNKSPGLLFQKLLDEYEHEETDIHL